MKTFRNLMNCRLWALLIGMLILYSGNAAGEMGNVDGVGDVDLKDAVLSLQVSAGFAISQSIDLQADVNGDGAIGLEEAIYGLQVVANIREPLKIWYKDADGDRISDGTSIVSATRPSDDYYEETELYMTSGDPDDSREDVFVSSMPSELSVVQSFIEKSGADWEAESNSVSQLPNDERKMRLGAILPDTSDRSALRKFRSTRSKRADLPVSFDWRNNNGNFVTPIRDQGNCGSCWAFATTAALESQMLISGSANLDLSEQIVVSCSDAGSCSGGYISFASDFLRNTGTNSETCYPYTVTNGNCANACTNWQNSAYAIDSWSYVNWGETATVSEIKNALYENGPLVSTLTVYEDFYSYRSGIYSYAWGQYEGGHAIVIVGWDDTSSCFIVKNSWNTWWGETGYFRIAYSELNGKTAFGKWTIAYHTQPACNYEISPTTQSFGSASGTGSVNVTAPSGCSWTATSNASWINLTSGSNGSGNGTVSYSVAENTSTSSRTGTITIAGKTFTITQAGATLPGQLQFSISAYSVSESGGSAIITVTRTSGSDGSVSVDYATSDGSAVADVDYTSVSGTLSFADGETSKTFSVNITDDSVIEGDETVNLVLSNPTGGATLGSPNNAVLTIVDGGTDNNQIYTGRIPDSGQTKCYDEDGTEINCAGTGQDGEYLINPSSYKKLDANGNDLPDSATSWAMVRDNVTGLIWEVKQNKDGVQDYSNPHDADNTYTWYDSNPETNGGDAGTPGDGTDTEDFINALNAENYGGYSHWRLPTMGELALIVDSGRYNPAINTTYFPHSMSSAYWSSTSYVDADNAAWAIGLHDGYDSAGNKSGNLYVYAVYDENTLFLDNLTNNDDGTITDTETGLMWQQTPLSNTITWQAAILYCKSLQLAGYSNWRLPSKKELRSTISYKDYRPAMNEDYFLSSGPSSYWTSTSVAENTNNAWVPSFTDGIDNNLNDKSYNQNVRTVRGGQPLISGHLYITSPLQASHWNIGDTMPIKWDTQDISGNVEISLSRDGGLTFDEIIADSTPNDGSYTWTVTGSASVNCALKVEPLTDPSKGTVQSLFEIK